MASTDGSKSASALDLWNGLEADTAAVAPLTLLAETIEVGFGVRRSSELLFLFLHRAGLVVDFGSLARGGIVLFMRSTSWTKAMGFAAFSLPSRLKARTQVYYQ